MNSALKQRLVGATVIVALGVIFVPMLLERGADDSRVSVRMEIPPKPDMVVRDKLDDPPEIKPIEILEPIDKAIDAARPSVSVTKPEPRPDSSVTKPASQTGSAGTPEKGTEKPHAKPDTAPVGRWLVQVGSFSREDNARLLRDKLKNSGYAAYLESAKSDVGPVYRVRIGPATSRTDAEKLVGKLSKQGGYRAIVLADD